MGGLSTVRCLGFRLEFILDLSAIAIPNQEPPLDGELADFPKYGLISNRLNDSLP
ncbi:MAG: hypothetical protein HC925_08210 [Coleofasciculaceae cyanobacterium SM2_3_26]|nr:hypothetical protein [Coleofasciculaceae cyanobacterium SM2_3_26]